MPPPELFPPGANGLNRHRRKAENERIDVALPADAHKSAAPIRQPEPPDAAAARRIGKRSPSGNAKPPPAETAGTQKFTRQPTLPPKSSLEPLKLAA